MSLCHLNDAPLALNEDTVRSIARLLDGQVLTDGSRVCAAEFDDDDGTPFIKGFNPALLPVQVQDYVRDRLAGVANGRAAARLFDDAIRHGRQLSLTGEDLMPARMTASIL